MFSFFVHWYHAGICSICGAYDDLDHGTVCSECYHRELEESDYV